MAIKSLNDLQALCNANAEAIRAKSKNKGLIAPNDFAAKLRDIPLGTKLFFRWDDRYDLVDGEDIAVITDSNLLERNFYLWQLYGYLDNGYESTDYISIGNEFVIHITYTNGTTAQYYSMPYSYGDQNGLLSDTINLIAAYYVGDSFCVDLIKNTSYDLVHLSDVKTVAIEVYEGNTGSTYLAIEGMTITASDRHVGNYGGANELTRWRNNYINAVKGKIGIVNTVPTYIENIAGYLNGYLARKITFTADNENNRIEANETVQLPCATTRSIAVLGLLTYETVSFGAYTDFDFFVVTESTTHYFSAGDGQAVDTHGRSNPIGYLSYVDQSGTPVTVVFSSATTYNPEPKTTQEIIEGSTAIGMTISGNSSVYANCATYTIKIETA